VGPTSGGFSKLPPTSPAKSSSSGTDFPFESSPSAAEKPQSFEDQQSPHPSNPHRRAEEEKASAASPGSRSSRRPILQILRLLLRH
jgi:cobalamin biosynthesis Mg chelatase CobN